MAIAEPPTIAAPVCEPEGFVPVGPPHTLSRWLEEHWPPEMYATVFDDGDGHHCVRGVLSRFFGNGDQIRRAFPVLDGYEGGVPLRLLSLPLGNDLHGRDAVLQLIRQWEDDGGY